MADEDSTNLPEPEQETKGINPFNFSFADMPSDNDFNFDSDSDDSLSDGETKDKDKNEPLIYTRQDDEITEEDNSPEANLKRFSDVLGGRRMRRLLKEEDEEYVYSEDLYDFPKDPERWKEEDLEEIWADPPLETEKTGWDPVWADEDDWDIVQDEIADGKDPDIAPFYIPYRKPYPVIPDNHFDISSPKSVVEELDRIEEFLIWVSYIFPDGSSYEGTVWDDLAHGKGVYVAEEGLVRYEGEWLQNNMEGHGVVEVEIPDIEPVPGSKLEAKMRAQGKIISRDFMSPEDKKWLEMDIEDSIRVADGEYEIPFYENKEWINQFGSKPEKGRYRYAGQWKHSRMHGCGVYTLNERTIYGRFYFGELVDDEDDDRCDVNISAMHAGIAEVAAAKSRMFVNKPDGMVREQRGPYSDPQHPYFYEEEDAWMAPGFINQFYDVPDYWKTYVHDVDQEREMWLNSFYKAPLRLPMPAELEYWWSKDERPEFILINKEPEPDPEDPTKLIYTEDPLILHTTTGRLINYIEDEEHGLRLFWQPPLEEGEEVDPEKVEFLPLGFDEFYGREASVKKETIWMRLITGVENACKPGLDKLGKWIEEKKKGSEMKIKLMEQELECVEAEICLEEIIEDIAADLKKKEKEEEKKAQMGLLEEEDASAPAATQDEKASAEEQVEEDEEEEEEEDDDDTPSSFGFVNADQNTAKDEQKGKNPGKSPFSTTSLSFASCSLASMAPPKLQHSFLSWKKGRSLPQTTPSCNEDTSSHLDMSASVSFPRVLSQNGSLRAAKQGHWNFQMGSRSKRSTSQLHSLSRVLCGNPKTSQKEQRLRNHNWLHPEPESESDNILSLHIPVFCLESYTDVK